MSRIFGLLITHVSASPGQDWSVLAIEQGYPR